MLPCNDCRDFILDYLYGLLDVGEAAAVEAHLASCPACAAARDEAARMQGLIAKAAKGAFPAVRFEAPVAKPAKTASQPIPRPATAQQPSAHSVPSESRGAPAVAGGRRSLRVGVWLPWAVAAAVLIAIPGTVVPVMGVLNRAETAKRDADITTAKVTSVETNIEQVAQGIAETQAQHERALAAAEQPLKAILAKWTEEEKESLAKQVSSPMSVFVQKPATVQPGAPNEFRLVMRNRDAVAPGKVVAEVRDQADAVIHSQPIDEQALEHTIRLPAKVWTTLTPQSELYLSVASVDEKSQKRTELQDRVRLLGPVYTTVVATDKPQYRPGETVFFRSLTLDRVSFTPPPREQAFRYELRGPRGQTVRAGVVAGGTELARVSGGKLDTVLGPDSQPLRGVGTGSILLPPDASDGDYTLTLNELPHPAGYPASAPFPAVRHLKVQSGATETYRKEITYLGATSYSAGETVTALAKLKLRDAAVEDAVVKAVVTADGKNVNVVSPLTTGKNGEALLQFALPAELPQGDVRLRVMFQTKTGREEIVAERVPVVGRHVTVEFFPEGGNLVAGVPCRVYFRATTPSGLPVDITGVLTDGREVLADVKTMTDVEPGVNRGIGWFEFTPKLGTPVWVKLSAPTIAFAPLLTPEDGKFAVAPAVAAGGPAVIGSRTGFLLPEPLRRGVVMKVLNPVTAPGEPIRVHLQSVARPRNLVVGAYTRGRLSDTQKVTAQVGQVAEVLLMAGTDPRGGVVRITVFEEPGDEKGDLTPVAERLVFRKPGELLNIDLALSGDEAGAGGFKPGSRVDLGVTATTDKGKKQPAAAILYAAVVNSAVAPGPKDHMLTTHFLIAGEVSTPDALEYADFLLGNHPKAPETLDLVLATQGWRRFAEQTPEGFVKDAAVPTPEQVKEHANLMVCTGQYTTWAEAPSVKEHRRLYETYWPAYEKAVKKYEAVRESVEAAKADTSDEARLRELAAQADLARDEALAASRKAEEAAEPVARFRGAGWYAVAGFGLLALLLGAASLARPDGRLPLGIGTVGSLGLVAFLVFALGMADRTHAADENRGADAIAAAPAPQAIEKIAVPPRVVVVEAVQLGGGTAIAMGTTTQGTPDAKRNEGPWGRGDGTPGKKGGHLGSGVEGFSGFNPPPMMPGVPKLDGSPLPPGVGYGGVGGFAGGTGGGAGPGRGSSGAPGGGFASPYVGPGAAYWLGRPGPQPFPYTMPPVKPADPNSVFPLTFGGGPKGKGGVKLKSGDTGWEPGDKKPVTEAELADREGAFQDWLKKDTLRLRAAAPAVAPPPPAPATGGGISIDTAPPRPLVADDGRDRGRSAELRQLEYIENLALARENADKKAHEEHIRLRETLDRLMPRAERAALPAQTAGRAKWDIPMDEIARRRVQVAVPRVAPLVVREYAAPRPGAGEQSQSRVESDTVLWQPVIVLPSDGKTTLTFHVGNAGGYEVIVAGHTLDGRIGAVREVVPVASIALTTPAIPGGRPAPAGTVPPGAPGKPDKP